MLISVNKESYCLSFIKLDSASNSNQYFVSLASFKAILNLFI